MCDHHLKAKAQTFAGPGLSEKTENVCKSFLAKFRRPVNLSDLFFHLLPVSGCLLAGGWTDRLTLWLPLLDLTAKLLREVSEGRV